MQISALLASCALFFVLPIVLFASDGIEAQSVIVATAVDDDTFVDLLGPQVVEDDNDDIYDDMVAIYDEDDDDDDEQDTMDAVDTNGEYNGQDDEDVEQIVEEQQVFEDEDDDEDDEDEGENDENVVVVQEQFEDDDPTKPYSAASVQEQQQRKHSTRYAPVLYTPNVASMSLASQREQSSPKQQYAAHKSKGAATLTFSAFLLPLVMLFTAAGYHVLH